jgi:hypothetical protein
MKSHRTSPFDESIDRNGVRVQRTTVPPMHLMCGSPVVVGDRYRARPDSNPGQAGRQRKAVVNAVCRLKLQPLFAKLTPTVRKHGRRPEAIAA